MDDEDLNDLEALVLMLLAGDELSVEELLELERLDSRDGVKARSH